MTRSLFDALPRGWRTVPLKHAARLNPEVLPENTPADAEISYVDIAALDGGDASATLSPKELTFGTAPSRARRVLRDGDTILSTVRTYLKAVANFPTAPQGLIASTGFAVLRPNGMLHPRFAYWAALAEPFIENVVAHSEGVSYPAINPSVLGALHMPVPPPDAQVRIASFLDQQTSRIDSLIAEKEALYERLFEYFESAIAFRILGADVTGPRTKTNVAEVPELPKGWALTPLMRLTDPSRPIMYGIVLPGPNIEEGPSVPIVKGGDVRPHRLKLALLNRTTPEIELPFARARLAEGDIVYSIRGTIGDAELVPAELAGANITQDAARIAPRSGIDRRWLLFAAKSRPVFAQLDQLSLGAAVRGINIFDLKRARVPTPPLAVQRCIADELSNLGERISTLREHCISHIQKLREYRSSLISSAVTGQLDISTYASKAIAGAEEALA